MADKKYSLIILFFLVIVSSFSLMAADVYAPNVTLVSPANNNYNKTSQIFSCNITDDVQVANLTVYVWNSSGNIVNQTTTNLSGVANSTSWTISFLNDGNYTWNCLGRDNSSNSSLSLQGNYTFVYDTTAPNFTNVPNYTQIVNHSVSYSIVANDANFVSSYWLNDTSIFNINPMTGLITNVTGLSVARTYYLIVFVNDSLNNTANSSFWINMTNDTTAPSISLVDPYAGKVTDSSLTFSFTVSDQSPTSCSLILDNSVLSTFQADINSNANTYSYSGLTPGTSHTWGANCTDSFGNNNSASYSFSVSSTAASSTVGSSSASSDVVIYYPTIQQLVSGYYKTLKVNDGYHFSFNNNSYDITLKSINGNSSIVSVSGSGDVSLNATDTKVDINNDSFYDIDLINARVDNIRSAISIKTIHETVPIVLASPSPVIDSGLNNNTVNGSLLDLNASSETPLGNNLFSKFYDPSWFSSKNIYYILIGVLTLFILCIIFFVVRGFLKNKNSPRFKHKKWKM